MTGFFITLTLLVLAYFTGTIAERRHFKHIKDRELKTKRMVVSNFESVTANQQTEGVHLVTGNVVISLDYFKRFIASLRAFFGGRIKTYEPLLDRARREAILRMKEQALQRGFNTIINVRLETSRIANSVSDDGTAGVEILAFGTALKLPEPSQDTSLIG